MKKAYFFSHDRNARNDEKILKLRSEYGWEGYGLYFALLEILFETEEQKISFDNIKFLSYNLNVKKKKLEQFINYCCTVELLKKDENYFWSNGLKKRCEEINKKIEQTREAGRISAQKKKEKKQQMLENRCNENSTDVEKSVNENLTIKLNKINNSIKDNIDKNLNIEIKDNVVVGLINNKLSKIIKYYEANIGLVLPATAPLLIELSEKFDEKLVFKAIDIACMKNKRNLSYINGILRDWERKGYKILSDIENEQNNKSKSDFNYTKSTFDNLENLYDNDSS